MKRTVLIEMHEVFGNMPEAWHIAADDLLLASNFLRSSIELESESAPPDSDVAHLRILPPELMLRGLAVEVYFKAIWTKRGNKLVSNSRYTEVPGAGSHDLVQLADVLGLQFTAIQRNLLVRLSAYIEYLGRYPIPKRAEQFSTTTLRVLVDAVGTYWSIPDDDATFDTIITIINKQLS